MFLSQLANNVTFIALDWSHVPSEHAHRRLRFPGWSPLRWGAKDVNFARSEVQITEYEDLTIDVCTEGEILRLPMYALRFSVATSISPCLYVAALTTLAKQRELFDVLERPQHHSRDHYLAIDIRNWARRRDKRYMKVDRADKSLAKDTVTSFFLSFYQEVLGLVVVWS